MPPLVGAFIYSSQLPHMHSEKLHVKGLKDISFLFMQYGHTVNKETEFLYDTINAHEAPVKYSLGESFIFFDDLRCLST